jgi:hypothetical protein
MAYVMTGSEGAQQTADRIDKGFLIQVSRWCLLAVIAASSLLAVMTSERSASEAEFRDALSNGAITEVTIGPTRGIELTFGAPNSDDQIIWRTGPWPWDRHATNELSIPRAKRIAEGSGVAIHYAETDWAAIAGGLAGLLVVGTIIFGPQPRSFTKWGAFWWAMLPLGVGVIWLLLKEAPWSRTATSLPEPLPYAKQKETPDGDSRRTWPLPFLLAILSGSVLNALL